jgi:hypothetical protein
MGRFAVVYGVVLDTNEGPFFDILFLGGCTDTEQQAADLANDLTGDKSIPGIVIPKTYPIEDGPGEIQKMAHKQFCQTATEMYDVDERTEREKARKKK